MGRGPWIQPDDQLVPNFALSGSGFNDITRNALFGVARTSAIGPDRPADPSWDTALANQNPSTAYSSVAYERSRAVQRSRDGDTWTHEAVDTLALLTINAVQRAYPQIGPPDPPPGATVEFEAPAGVYLDAIVEWEVQWRIISEAATTTFAGDGAPAAPLDVPGGVSMSLMKCPENVTAKPAPAERGSWPVLGSSAAAYNATPSTITTQFTGTTQASLAVQHAFLSTEPPIMDWPAEPEWASGVTGSVTSRIYGGVEFVAFTAWMMYRPPRYRIVTPSKGMWNLRQRQSLTGNAGGWPLRQRQTGGATGSWPLRQRQTGT